MLSFNIREEYPCTMRCEAMLLGAALMGCRAPVNAQPVQRGPAPASVSLHMNLPYLDDGSSAHQLDLALPAKRGENPLLIFVHGGAWVSGDKSMYQRVGFIWGQRGYAVAIPNYRLSSSGAPKHPAHVEDIAAAYRWLVANAGKYGYRKDRIYVIGHSAGAHIAGLLATGDYLRHSPPTGFVGLEGIYDLPKLDSAWPAYRNWFITKAFGNPNKWAVASPTRRPVVLKTPWLVIHSTQDELVDVGQSQDFAKHLRDGGVSVSKHADEYSTHEAVASALLDPNSKVFRLVSDFVSSK